MNAARRRLAAEALPLAAFLALAGVLYARSLDTRANFDEGVYLASLDAIRHGQALGTQVEIPQPPGFYVLLQAISFVFGHGVRAERIGFLLIALIGLVAAYAIGRKLAGVAGGFAAAGLLAVAAPYPAQAAQVEADTACVVLALCSIAVLVHARGRPWPALAAGALAGAAMAVKLLAVPVVAPLAVLLVARRSGREALAFVAGALAVGAALAIRYAHALGDLYHSVAVEHRNAQGLGSFGSNAHRVLLHPLDWHTPAGLAIPAGIVLAAAFCRNRESVALAAWIVASAAFLVYQRPLLDHHLVLIATALAVTGGVGFGAAAERLPRRALAVGAAALAVVVAGGFAQEHRRLARDDQPEPAGVLWAVAALRAHTSPDELVGTDLPIVPYLAHRRVAGQLIDSSYGRLLSGTQTTRDILDVLAQKRIRAVVVGRNYRLKPDLIRALRSRYGRRLANGGVTLYLAG
jgi:4-amino-4-deoxy-L-arabinose transferase-like glycosyltransferase